MQDKTISVIKLAAKGSGPKPFAPFNFSGTLTAPIDRHIISAIEEANGSDNFPAVCVSLAAFSDKIKNKGAGGKDDIESFAGVFIDLDADKGVRPDEAIPIGDLVKFVETEFPNTAGMVYQSYNGKGAHVWLLYDEQCNDDDVNADAATMVRDKFFNSEYKDFLDDGAFTPERKIYIRKGTEPRIVLGEGLDATKRYYDDDEERKAVEDNIKAYFKKKKDAAKKKDKKVDKKQGTDSFTPHDKNMLNLLRDMHLAGLIGNLTKTDNWINVDAAKWSNASSNPQWSIPKDCKQVNKFGKANTKEFNSIKEYVSSVVENYNTGRLNYGSAILPTTTTNKLLAAAKRIDDEHNPSVEGKKDSDKEKIDMPSASLRKIIQGVFKDLCDDTGTVFYRVDNKGENSEKAIFAINKKGYNSSIGVAKKDFILFFGEDAWDALNTEVVHSVLKKQVEVKETEIKNTWGDYPNETGLTMDEFMGREIDTYLKKNYLETVVVMDAISMYVANNVHTAPMVDRHDVVRESNAFRWNESKKRLEIWTNDNFLYDNKFETIEPQDTSLIYVNKMNNRKTNVVADYDKDIADKFLANLKEYVVNNPRLATGGKWQGKFLAVLPLLAVNSAFLGNRKARPIIALKAHSTSGKTYICDAVNSTLGVFGNKFNAGLTLAAMKRQAGHSGLMIIDDGFAGNKREKNDAINELVKRNYDNTKIIQMGRDSDETEEFMINSLLMLAGTQIPTDKDDMNTEAISRMVMMALKIGKNEDKAESKRIKFGIEDAIKFHESGDNAHHFLKHLISCTDRYITEYNYFVNFLNDKARELDVNNKDRRADVGAAFVAGYSTLFNDEQLSDDDAMEIFIEYCKQSDIRDRSVELFELLFTTKVNIGRLSSRHDKDQSEIKEVIETESGDVKEMPYVSGNNDVMESLATDKYFSIVDFIGSDNEEVNTFFNNMGVYKVKYGKKKDCELYLRIQNNAPIFERKTTKDKPLRGETTIEDVYGKLETQHGFAEVEKERVYVAISENKLILVKDKERITIGKGITIKVSDLKEKLNIDDDLDADDDASGGANADDDVPF